MKTILVDAVYCFVIPQGEEFGIFKEMHEMLGTFPNRKVILTGANDEQAKEYGLDKMPYEVFSLKHNPEKDDPKYYEMMLQHFSLTAGDVVYFEHAPGAVESARKAEITTYLYDEKKADLAALKRFLEENL